MNYLIETSELKDLNNIYKLHETTQQDVQSLDSLDDKKRKLSRIQNTLDELITKEKIEDNSEKLKQNLEVLLLQSVKIVKENDEDKLVNSRLT